MKLDILDWIVLALYGIVCVAIGLAVARRAGEGRQEFFLSGRRLPWWLLGVSLVATTFSTDTPNLITELVRTDGVSQNWAWWARGGRTPGAPARMLGLEHRDRGHDRAARGAVVKHVVSRRRAGRRGLRGAAHARRAHRERRHADDAAVQRAALCCTGLAVDHRGARVADRLSRPRLDRRPVSAHRPGDRAERPGLLRDARVFAARALRPDDRVARGGIHVHHQHSPQLGRVLRGRGLLPPVRGP